MGKLDKNQFPKSVQHFVDKTKSELIMIIHKTIEKENNYVHNLNEKVRELNKANEKYSSLEKTLNEYIKSNSEKDEEISNAKINNSKLNKECTSLISTIETLKSRISSLEFENNLSRELLKDSKTEFMIYKGIIAILCIIIGFMIVF